MSTYFVNIKLDKIIKLDIVPQKQTPLVGAKHILYKQKLFIFWVLWKVMTKGNPVHRKHNFHKTQTILDYVKSVSVISGGEGGRAENLEQN